MPVVFTILKVVLILLAVLVLLLIAAMFVPLGFSVEYRRGRVRVAAICGPLRRTLWSYHAGAPAPPFPGQSAAPGTGKSPPVSSAPSAQAPPRQAQPPAGKEPAGPVRVEPKRPEPPDKEPDAPKAPAAAAGRMERMLALAEEDPRALLSCIAGHIRWLHRHSHFKVRVQHLNVFWTVTCEDAARTAIVYGAALPALNTLLTLARQVIQLQSDRLWLEPDFTGQRREEREISFTMSARAALLLHLLYRIWRDPLLQPQPKKEPQPV